MRSIVQYRCWVPKLQNEQRAMTIETTMGADCAAEDFAEAFNKLNPSFMSGLVRVRAFGSNDVEDFQVTGKRFVAFTAKLPDLKPVK